MGKVYDSIDSKLSAWIAEQEMFFVSTAPLSGNGLINCSPKGLDSFRILSPTNVAYLDLHGSGIETLAHVKENARIVIMFCAMIGPPMILRLHGRGTVHDLNSAKFQELLPHFPAQPHPRSIIEMELERIADSCGYGVPKYEFVEQRDTLPKSAESKGAGKLAAYRSEKNASSIDGLPGI